MDIRTDAGRHSVDKLKLKIPVFGVLQTKTACASFARTLSTLLQAGMPMIEAIDIAASTMTNVMYKDALMKAKSGVALGLPLSNQLKASQIFPLGRMIYTLRFKPMREQIVPRRSDRRSKA